MNGLAVSRKAVTGRNSINDGRFSCSVHISAVRLDYVGASTGKIEIRTGPAAVGSIVNCATASNDAVAGFGAVARPHGAIYLTQLPSCIEGVADTALGFHRGSNLVTHFKRFQASTALRLACMRTRASTVQIFRNLVLSWQGQSKFLEVLCCRGGNSPMF